MINPIRCLSFKCFCFFFCFTAFRFNCTITPELVNCFSNYFLLFNQHITSTCDQVCTSCDHVYASCDEVYTSTYYHVLCRVQAQQETAVVTSHHPPRHNLKVMVQPPVKERPKMLKMTRNERTITSVRSNLLGTNL